MLNNSPSYLVHSTEEFILYGFRLYLQIKMIPTNNRTRVLWVCRCTLHVPKLSRNRSVCTFIISITLAYMTEVITAHSSTTAIRSTGTLQRITTLFNLIVWDSLGLQGSGGLLHHFTHFIWSFPPHCQLNCLHEGTGPGDFPTSKVKL